MAKDVPIAVTEQASKQIRVIGAEGAGWSWSPKERNEGEAAAWGLPSDVKLRENALYGGLWMVVTDSYGYAGIVSYPDKRVRWSRNVGGNPHAAELLPDGNIAVAASDGGWVRVYAASQGPWSDTFGEFRLPGAHGVLWDPDREVLWATGDDRLIALRVEGPPAAPALRPVHECRLPSLWGHDLSPVYGNPDRLWVTTNGGVYQYEKSSDSWSTEYAGAEGANRPFVKSMGNQPSGALVQTAPKEGMLYEWGTDTVDQFLPERKLRLPGASIYKARVWRPEYR
jgi:hypothetical protein